MRGREGLWTMKTGTLKNRQRTYSSLEPNKRLVGLRARFDLRDLHRNEPQMILDKREVNKHVFGVRSR